VTAKVTFRRMVCRPEVSPWDSNQRVQRKEMAMAPETADSESRLPSFGRDQRNLDTFADQSFPRDGLVAKSRIAYQTTPLAIEEISRGVFVFRGAGGTVTAVSASHGSAVIDTGFGPRVEEIRRAIACALPQGVRWLVNTHWHFDHTDGNQTFAEAGATIVAHANCRTRLSRDRYVPSLEWRIPASPRMALPTITLDGSSHFDIGSEILQLLPQPPSHADGDLVVYLPSADVLVTGDLFNNGSYPVIDESSGGSLRGMIEAIELLLPLVKANTAVVSGHGPIANREALVGFLICCMRLRVAFWR
jgi:cyclase